jgi:hypothetical protein
MIFSCLAKNVVGGRDLRAHLFSSFFPVLEFLTKTAALLRIATNFWLGTVTHATD